jgi:hypothetical protein
MMREELEATTRAVVGAHEAHVREAIDCVGWERRGVLQTLARDDRAEWWRRLLRRN